MTQQKKCKELSHIPWIGSYSYNGSRKGWSWLKEKVALPFIAAFTSYVIAEDLVTAKASHESARLGAADLSGYICMLKNVRVAL